MKRTTGLSKLPVHKLILLVAMAVALATNVIAQVAAIDPNRPQMERDHDQEQEHEQTQKYACLMHPEVITDHPGNCPKCGMKLVPIKQKKRPTPSAQH